MGKGDKTRARAKKQARRAELAGIPGLASAPRREPNGNGSTRPKRQAGGAQDRSPDKVALQARARMMGKEGKPLATMRAQALGEPAGRAIYLVHEGEAAARLWEAYAALTAAEARYATVVLGKSLHAKTAKVEMMPERIEARDDDQPDLRSEDEKHRDAVNAWMRWRGRVMQLPAHEQAAIFDVVRGRREPVEGGTLTGAGTRFVEALKSFVCAIEASAREPVTAPGN